MLRRYNLALTPNTKGVEAIKIAQQISHLADEYLLGNHSLPHVTLYQFEAPEDAIDNIWQMVSAAWVMKPITLEFSQVSCKTFDYDLFWVALMPDNRKALESMHTVIANVLGLPIKSSFDPHMTLLNSKNQNCKMEIDKILSSYEPILDGFTLSLGQSDEIGQFIKMLNRLK